MIGLAQNERIEIDGLAWGVERRLPTGFQLVGIGDGALRKLTDGELIEAYDQGRVRFLRAEIASDEVRRANPHNRDWTSYREADRHEAARRKRYLEAVRETFGPPPYCDAKIEEATPDLRKLAEDPDGPVSRASIRRWLAKERRDPKNLRLLAAERQNQGNRPPVFHADVEAAMASILDQYVLRPEPAPVTDIYATLRDRIKTDPILSIHGQRPSLSTLYRRADRLDAEERIMRQRGRRAARVAFPEGKAGPEETVPLGVIEIDHTRIDGHLVRDGVLVGRPWLSAAIDRATRACLGFVLTWEQPSYATVMLLLRHVIRPKSYVAERFPETIRHSWPCFGVPRGIVVDNGVEFHSKHLENACDQLGIRITYAERKSPEQKGRIERFFRTLNQGLMHLIPGTTLSNWWGDRDSDYDGRRSAAITLETLNELLHKFIIDVYMQRLHRGSKDIPFEAWSEGVARHPVRLPNSLRDLDLLIAGTEDRTIQRTGIEIFSLFYMSEELKEIRTTHGASKVTVRYDPLDLGRIWVPHPETGRHIVVPCTMPRIADGMTLWQRQVLLRHLGDKAKGASERTVLQAMAELRRMIDDASGRKSTRSTTRNRQARFVEQPTTPDRLGEKPAPRDQSVPASLDEALDTETPTRSVTKAPSSSGRRKERANIIEPGMSVLEPAPTPVLDEDDDFQPLPGFTAKILR